MAHFAKLDENNVVLEVIVVDNEVLKDEQGDEQEALGLAWLVQWSGGHTNWKQTSYNNNFRKNYAGIGYKYDPTLDAFITLQPYPSWTFNADRCDWDPPAPYPNDGKKYDWNEATQSWDEVTGE